LAQSSSDTSPDTTSRSSGDATADAASGTRRGSQEAPPPKSEWRQWGEAILVAGIIVLILRTLFFDLFRIPTPSMEKNLLVGDYLFVSKLHYGTRLPMTVGVPFTGVYLPGVEFPYVRLPGFSSVERGDPIVFNHPPKNGPIDRKVHYVKRVMGLPGDSVMVRDKVVHVNGTPYPLGEGMQQYWSVFKQDARYQLSGTRLESLGITQARRTQNPKVVRMLATPEAIQSVSDWPWIDRVAPFLLDDREYYDGRMYPAERGYTPDNYGPVPVPQKGQTVTLTGRNWPVYGPVINRYEGHTARQMSDTTFAIDGVQTRRYTFKQNYYFVMGDNRDNSEDSRYWGYVPMDHIVGKAVLTYFSWDSASNLPRLSRIFNLIEDDEVFREQRVLPTGTTPAADTTAADTAATTEAAAVQ
jgi:signal peptidase I